MDFIDTASYTFFEQINLIQNPIFIPKPIRNFGDSIKFYSSYMGLLDLLFGNKTKKIQEFKSRGAIIIDVRSKMEYNTSAIPGSKNIPLQVISSKISEIRKWNKPVILCCASGARSGTASSILKRNGIEAMNGGGWFSLSKKL